MKSSFPFVSLLLCFCLLSCSRSQDKPTASVSPIPVKVLTVTSQPLASSSHYVATVEEQSRIPLSVETGGQVLSLSCRVGERVRKGQPLLMVDSAAAVDARTAALASLRQAEDAYARVSQVREVGAVTDQQFVDLETKLSQARSLYSAAQRRVANCTLLAPCDGVVADVSVSLGQHLTSLQTAVELYCIDRLFVSFSVPESDMPALHVGDEGAIVVPAVDTTFRRIRIVEKGMKANSLSHTYCVRAEVFDKSALLPGMASKVLLSSAGSQAIVIPSICVQQTPSGKQVWVVSAEGLATRRAIEIGDYLPSGVVVTKGLCPGERVITAGHQKLYPSAPVQVQD